MINKIWVYFFFNNSESRNMLIDISPPNSFEESHTPNVSSNRDQDIFIFNLAPSKE